MKNILLVSVLFLLILDLTAQGLSSPIDVVYDAVNEFYYVSNYNGGDGFITRHDNNGDYLDVFATELQYVTGICKEGNILYVVYNTGFPQEHKPCFLRAYSLGGTEIFTKLISSDGFINLMDADNDGRLYFGNQNSNWLIQYDIEAGSFTNLVNGIYYIYGVHYYEPEDRLYFISASSGVSKVYSIPAGGTDETLEFNHSGEIDDLVIDPENGKLFMSSWATDHPTDTLGKVYFSGNWYDEHVLSAGHHYAFGMCIGKNRQLVVCNAGSNSLSFLSMETGINEFKSHRLTAYPNPTKGLISIELPENIHEITGIEVIDMLGSVVKKESGQIQRNTVQIDLSVYPPGHYLLKVFTRDDYYFTQLILQ